MPNLLHCSDKQKYYSDSVAIIPLIGYNAIIESEVQNYVYVGKTGRREMGNFR